MRGRWWRKKQPALIIYTHQKNAGCFFILFTLFITTKEINMITPQQALARLIDNNELFYDEMQDLSLIHI
ncbi:anthranilate phosphoribosyltransferase, partial [Kingella kingae]|nr:anthranilate phosphoribosyltransferase [Kingella kingae]